MAEDLTSAIEVENLSRSFGTRPALAGVGFQVQKGELFGFLGPNGAGKSTTLKILLGLLRADGGRVRVLGLDPVASPLEVRRRVGVLFEDCGHYSRLSVRANLTFFARLYGQDRSRVEAVLEAVGLSDRLDERAGALSKGMRQRLGLARSLLGQPEILFLDEPTAGLDPVSARSVRELVARFAADGGTVFLTTHLMEEAQELCGRVAFLKAGQLVAVGSPGQLIAENLPEGGSLEDLFVRLAGRTSPQTVEAPASETVPHSS